MTKLDWLLFGNGHGMASPYFDDTFYWLKDMSRGDRKKAKGRFYRLGGGFGAQLYSVEWTKPEIGAERLLAGMTFRVFHATRVGPRVDVAWSHVPKPKTAQDLEAISTTVKNWGHG